ncbi:type II secretion system protein [Cognaticolwellia mytili]|uniref:type II secretion system protein n=1 Tax=Cognaticolwellia mytili TaxID=1888913 RepID=UPI000A1785B6|nr:prepilin-type N-terminal cleavage/methylation domain-containing protein [Cognaticolwellia mytili]
MKTLTNRSNAQQGFTLIELVVVIVILGILAATAAPKFIDLTSDARASVMQGVEGSIESAVSMVHAKALVDGKTSGRQTVIIDGLHYSVFNGYPSAQTLTTGTGADADTAIGILGLLDIESSTDGTSGNFQVTNAAPALIQHISATTKTACQISYPDSTALRTRPNVTIVVTGC